MLPEVLRVQMLIEKEDKHVTRSPTCTDAQREGI